jgi:hypothetical protein
LVIAGDESDGIESVYSSTVPAAGLRGTDPMGCMR